MLSPAELIAGARSRGSTYPDTTLRTLIVSQICVNAPNYHAVQYGDLVRIGRGLYRLADAASTGQVAGGPVAPDRPRGVVADVPPSKALHEGERR